MIATKFGIVRTPTGLDVVGTREYVRKAVEGSLERLGIDCIDLYYQHRVDRSCVEETWTELKVSIYAVIPARCKLQGSAQELKASAWP